jgi:hypothetical protein
LHEEVIPRLERTESSLFKQGFLEATRVVDDVTTSGIIRGCKLQFSADFDRLHAVAQRIVRGLYYREFGRPIPPESSVDAFYDVGFEDLPDTFAMWPLQRLLSTVQEEPEQIVEKGVFSYRYSPLEDSDTSVWQLIFFERIWFLVLANWDQFKPSTNKSSEK